jgi:hypothetical protein
VSFKVSKPKVKWYKDKSIVIAFACGFLFGLIAVLIVSLTIGHACLP